MGITPRFRHREDPCHLPRCGVYSLMKHPLKEVASVCVCPVTAPHMGKDPAPVCIVSSRWMSPAGVEVSAGEF